MGTKHIFSVMGRGSQKLPPGEYNTAINKIENSKDKLVIHLDEALSRELMITKITEQLRKPGPEKMFALGDSWLKRMTDKELEAKYKEVCKNG